MSGLCEITLHPAFCVTGGSSMSQTDASRASSAKSPRQNAQTIGVSMLALCQGSRDGANARGVGSSVDAYSIVGFWQKQRFSRT